MKHTYGKSLRALSLAAALLILCGALLCACGPSPASSDAALTVVCSNFVGYDFAREIITRAGYSCGADGDAAIILLSKQGQDMHGFEPSALDVANIAGADLFIYVGGESDAWVDAALKAANNPGLLTVSMMDVCDSLLEEEEFDYDPDAHGDEGTEVEYDEHVWTSVAVAQSVVSAIGDALARITEQKEAPFAFDQDKLNAGTASYLAELDAWKTGYESLAASGARRTLVIADRYPFAYLMRECGLTCYAAFPGCSSETQASFATQVFLTEKVREEGLPVIFTVDNSAGSVAETIAAQTGAEIRRLWSGQTIPGEDDPQTYLEMLERNYNNLSEALR